MKAVRMILVASLILGFTTCAVQAEGNGNKKAKCKMVAGTVSAVSATSITIKPKKKDAEDVTIAINDETKIKVNGKEAAASDIKEGMKATIKHIDGTATQINANDKKDKTKKKEKPEPKE
ncbi:MAG TPA: hypothetical protein PKK48_02910 [Phycisphaerae bacterium]|nr:hypothetical protein [Phycisphaerae bacterium]HPS53721.1 hypothetical protein [Phycisphaerae bacterium]